MYLYCIKLIFLSNKVCFFLLNVLTELMYFYLINYFLIKSLDFYFCYIINLNLYLSEHHTIFYEISTSRTMYKSIDNGNNRWITPLLFLNSEDNREYTGLDLHWSVLLFFCLCRGLWYGWNFWTSFTFIILRRWFIDLKKYGFLNLYFLGLTQNL